MKNWLNHMVTICSSDLSEAEAKTQIAELEEKYNTFSDEQKEKIHEIMNEEFDARDSVYVLSLLTFFWDNKSLKTDLILNMLKADYDWLECIMIQLQMTVRKLGTYRERRGINRKTYDKLAKILVSDYSYIPLRDRNSNRIVIITEQIWDELHSPTKLILEYIYILRKLGFEVLLFVCPSDGFLRHEVWYQAGKVINENRHISEKIEYRGMSVQYFQINLSSSDCLKEYAMMLTLIQAWNPLFVYSYGLGNVIGDLCKNITTLVHEDMQAIECPVSEGQILVRILKGDEEYEKMVLQSLSEHQSQLWIPQNFPVYFDGNGKDISRKELGLPEEQFLIAIVGNRLETEIDEEFVQIMKNIMKEYSCTAFVFIGAAGKLEKYFIDTMVEDRVFYLGFQQDLVSVYEVMDLYLNPKRMGGGYSSIMALHASLPVVTLPECDVAYNVGEEFVVSDYGQMFQTVGRYIEDTSFRKEKEMHAFEKGREYSEQGAIDFMKHKISAITQIIADQENNIWGREYKVEQ